MTHNKTSYLSPYVLKVYLYMCINQSYSVKE